MVPRSPGDALTGGGRSGSWCPHRGEVAPEVGLWGAFGCDGGQALQRVRAGTSPTQQCGGLGCPAVGAARGPHHHQPAPLGEMPMQGPGEKKSPWKTELEMDLWGPGWRHGMVQGGQPSCWPGQFTKATAEGMRLGDLGAGLTGGIFQLGLCQAISTSVALGSVWEQEGHREAQSARGWTPTAKRPVLGCRSQLLRPVLSFSRVSAILCHAFLSRKSPSLPRARAEDPWRWPWQPCCCPEPRGMIKARSSVPSPTWNTRDFTARLT